MVNQFLVGLSLVVIVMAIARFGRSSPPEAESEPAVATTGTRAADADSSRRSSGGAEADARARETEAKMTDDERFSLIVSVMGAVPLIGIPRDPRIPADVKNMSAGYTPGIARLGIPALQSSDASMGITNPGYRPDDKAPPHSHRKFSWARASTLYSRGGLERPSLARRVCVASTSFSVAERTSRAK